MTLLVDEYTAYHVAQVIHPVVLQRIAQEVENLNHTAVRAILVLLDVGSAHHLVIAGKFEDVGVHQEDEHVAAELEHELVLVLIIVLHRDIVVIVSVFVAIILLKAFGSVFEELHGFQGDGENILF
jgi:hypothetical protein